MCVAYVRIISVKRWSIYFLLSVSTIAIGYEAEATFPSKSVEPAFAQTIPVLARSDAKTNADEPAFVPEFTNIRTPEIDGIDLTQGDLRSCAVQPGRKWLALYQDRGKYFLERRKVNYGKWEDDAWGGYFPMRYKNDDTSLFVIQDTGKIKPGQVATYLVKSDYFTDGEKSSGTQIIHEGVDAPYKRIISVGDTTYTLRTVQATDANNDKVIAILLENGTSRQFIFSDDFRHCYLGDIAWIGDLDHDGKIDLALEYPPVNGDGVTTVLYISSLAKPGDMVTPYAVYHPISARQCPQSQR